MRRAATLCVGVFGADPPTGRARATVSRCAGLASMARPPGPQPCRGAAPWACARCPSLLAPWPATRPPAGPLVGGADRPQRNRALHGRLAPPPPPPREPIMCIGCVCQFSCEQGRSQGGTRPATQRGAQPADDGARQDGVGWASHVISCLEVLGFAWRDEAQLVPVPVAEVVERCRAGQLWAGRGQGPSRRGGAPRVQCGPCQLP
jgi:hypothetical protein